jgi:hypothetical protein
MEGGHDSDHSRRSNELPELREALEWKDHSRRQIKECGFCGMCHRVLKEHSADEHKTCDAAHQAEMDATPCEICGKRQKEHSQEQSMECLEKCREQRQRDKKGIEVLRKLSKELPGDNENITEDAAVMLVRDRWTDADTQKGCGSFAFKVTA